jgi:hypothetical protein
MLAAHGALHHFIINQVLFLWERRPAAMVSRQDAATTEKSLTYLKVQTMREAFGPLAQRGFSLKQLRLKRPQTSFYACKQ